MDTWRVIADSCWYLTDLLLAGFTSAAPSAILADVSRHPTPVDVHLDDLTQVGGEAVALAVHVVAVAKVVALGDLALHEDLQRVDVFHLDEALRSDLDRYTDHVVGAVRLAADPGEVEGAQVRSNRENLSARREETAEVNARHCRSFALVRGRM